MPENYDRFRIPLDRVVSRRWTKIDDTLGIYCSWYLDGFAEASNFFHNTVAIHKDKKTKSFSCEISGNEYGEDGLHEDLPYWMNFHEAKREAVTILKRLYAEGGFYLYEL